MAGQRRRMYLFERAYRDFAHHLSGFVRYSFGLCGKIWLWFWKGPGAKALELAIRVCVVLSGAVFAVLYVMYERSHGRELSAESVFAFLVIAGYVWILMWGWKAPLHVLSRFVSAACAAGTVAAVMSLLVSAAAILFSGYLLVLFLLTASSFVVFVPMRVLHWMWLMHRQITYRCPYDDCPGGHGGVPIHVCTCGQQYRDLYPSFYGIFHHVCRHNGEQVRLPTMDFLGRNKLERRCPVCNRPLRHTSLGELAERPVFLAGGPSTGKSVYLRQAIRQLAKNLDDLGAGTVLIDADDERLSIEQDYRLLDQGRVLAKTVGDVTRAFGLAIRLRKPKRVRCLLHLYDPPGEDFTSMQRLGKKQVLQDAYGIILLVDPFATSVLSHYARRGATYLKASSTTLYDVVAELVGAVNQLLMREAADKCAIPLAVVLNKVDALPTTEGYEFLANLLPINGSAFDANHQAHCKQALERLGEGRSVRALEQKFQRVQYFSCTALGRTPSHGNNQPFQASGVTAPFLWMLGLDGMGTVTGAKARS
ncbi:MAG: ATP-binding protein [Candidatus Anammoximicrobium sp.]|nr:ATP-binding protein [Candidatus Anammoximicrobium sp.]